jgi:hypothetical protein
VASRKQTDVLILGGGPVGIVAAGVVKFYKTSWRVTLIEPDQLCRSLDAGGLRYLRGSKHFQQLLYNLGIDYRAERVRGGLELMNGSVIKYPGTMKQEKLEEIQRIHYQRTRGTTHGFTPGAMNFAGEEVPRILLDRSEMIAKMLDGNPRVDLILNKQVAAIAPDGSVSLDSGETWEAAKLVISTIPIQIYMKTLLQRPLVEPVLQGRWLSATTVNQVANSFDLYDYVYSPWSSVGHRYSKDANGTWWIEESHVSKESAMAAAMVRERGKAFPGHLLPPSWNGWRPPAKHHLLGRFSAWDARYTVDQTAERVAKLLGESLDDKRFNKVGR